MTEKYEFPQSPRSRTYEGLDSLTREVQKLARPLLGQHGFTQVELISHWSEIMGTELAIGVKPVKLTFPAKDRANGTLSVRTAGGAFALLLEHQKGRIMEKVNTYFGYPAVSSLKIEQGGVHLASEPESEPEWPLSEEELAPLLEKVNAISDESLRQKTLEIGIKLLQHKNQS
ncbi:MAG: DUF721 domain-containing protein [Alphaproteobacteria bacterium]|nr:DUF721 domain-containing protein [Alphaproteobacteria bacterium]